MNPEVTDLALQEMDRNDRANALNSHYVDLLEARKFIASRSTNPVPNNISIILNQIEQLVAGGNKRINVDAFGVISPLLENHEGEPYIPTHIYPKGTILVLGTSNLIFFEVLNNTKRNYSCKKGMIIVDDKFNYIPVLSDHLNIVIEKELFSGLVFRNLNSLRENIASPSKRYTRQKRERMLEIINKQLKEVWSKYIP